MGKRNDEESSLELLLDTMCNTFGGIVFITILVALITNDVTQRINQIKYSKIPSTNNIEKVNEELAKNNPLFKEIIDSQKSFQKKARAWTEMSDFLYLKDNLK